MCCWWEPRYGWPHGVADRGLRLEPYADANELVLYQAALLTFGGAYAVLPYVYQGRCQPLWLAHTTQMIDGLALGETTPGPLIMVVAFVGFVGGYVKALFGPDALFLAGAVAASLVTWFTFLPSFLFILAGGPSGRKHAR